MAKFPSQNLHSPVYFHQESDLIYKWYLKFTPQITWYKMVLKSEGVCERKIIKMFVSLLEI